MDWKLINKAEAIGCDYHFIYTMDDLVAIADHSIIDMDNPASTDDGLILWDGKVGRITASGTIAVGVITNDTASCCHLAALTARRIEQATGLQVIPNL